MFERRNGGQYEADDGWLADRELADDPEALYDMEEEGRAEPYGDTLFRFTGVADFVNALYPDQMDLNEARQSFQEGNGDEEGL